jgi:hypothetical protein
LDANLFWQHRSLNSGFHEPHAQQKTP